MESLYASSVPKAMGDIFHFVRRAAALRLSTCSRIAGRQFAETLHALRIYCATHAPITLGARLSMPRGKKQYRLTKTRDRRKQPEWRRDGRSAAREPVRRRRLRLRQVRPNRRSRRPPIGRDRILVEP